MCICYFVCLFFEDAYRIEDLYFSSALEGLFFLDGVQHAESPPKRQNGFVRKWMNANHRSNKVALLLLTFFLENSHSLH